MGHQQPAGAALLHRMGAVARRVLRDLVHQREGVALEKVVEHGTALDGAPECVRVVIGASAGGIAALISLPDALPADFPMPILLVLHLAAKPAQASNLPAVLGWRTRLRVKWAEDGES